MNKLILNGKEIGIDFDAILKAKEEGKESFELQSDLIVTTEEERSAWFNNSKKDSIKTALEMEVKKHKKNLGLEFEGKGFDKLFEALTEKNKNEFTKEPSEQLASKEKDLQTLKSTIATLQSEKESVLSEFTRYKNKATIRRELESNLPNNLAFPKEDMILILENRFNPRMEEGKILYSINGEVAKNTTTLDPLGSKEVLTNFFKENQTYLKGASGGAGGTDSDPTKNSGSEGPWRYTIWACRSLSSQSPSGRCPAKK